MADWNLRLMRWVIEDGEPEVYTDQVLEWVIDFRYEVPFRLSANRDKVAVLVEKNCYRVNAEVVYISQDPKYMCCILDCVITIVSELGALLRMPLPSRCREGDYVAGNLWLQSPLCTAIQPYIIRHQWRVNRITTDSAAFSSRTGDLGTASSIQIPDTGSLKVDAYILNCTHVGSPVGLGGKPPINQEALQYLKWDQGHTL